MEKSRGLELNNSVELVMKERNIDIQSAIDWIEGLLAGVRAAFLENISHIPSWGEELDKKVKVYIDGLAQWVRGSDDWTFESGRYFGTKGAEIKISRKTALLPPSTGYIKKSG
jgi:hypothetical protein